MSCCFFFASRIAIILFLYLYMYFYRLAVNKSCSYIYIFFSLFIYSLCCTGGTDTCSQKDTDKKSKQSALWGDSLRTAEQLGKIQSSNDADIWHVSVPQLTICGPQGTSNWGREKKGVEVEGLKRLNSTSSSALYYANILITLAGTRSSPVSCHLLQIRQHRQAHMLWCPLLVPAVLRFYDARSQWRNVTKLI